MSVRWGLLDLDSLRALVLFLTIVTGGISLPFRQILRLGRGWVEWIELAIRKWLHTFLLVTSQSYFGWPFTTSRAILFNLLDRIYCIALILTVFKHFEWVVDDADQRGFFDHSSQFLGALGAKALIRLLTWTVLHFIINIISVNQLLFQLLLIIICFIMFLSFWCLNGFRFYSYIIFLRFFVDYILLLSYILGTTQASCYRGADWLFNCTLRFLSCLGNILVHLVKGLKQFIGLLNISRKIQAIIFFLNDFNRGTHIIGGLFNLITIESFLKLLSTLLWRRFHQLGRLGWLAWLKGTGLLLF